MVHQVTNHFQTFFVGEWHPGNVRPNGEPWDEEHRTAVFSGPVAIVSLKVFVVFIPISCGFERGFRLRQIWQFLWKVNGVMKCRWPDHVPLASPSKICPAVVVPIERTPRQSGDTSKNVFRLRLRLASIVNNP